MVQHIATLTNGNSPLVMARLEISEKMQLPKISSMYLSTMLTLMKSSDTPSRTSSRGKDYPSDLRRMKLVRGEVRTRQIGNLVATMWRDKRVVSLLLTNTSPEPEIHTIRQVVRGRRKRVVSADAMKKPDVVDVYNGGMNGVDVNDQYRSYYPPGTTSRKWWKYLLWFFVNLSMVNAYILEKLAGKKKRHQLDFRRELAKLLIAGYNG